jgi:hypothetical protein
MKKCALVVILILGCTRSFGWGFYAHQLINYYAVFLLPPEMMVLYKPNILFLSEHAVDPDKRRYAVAEEGPRHYIDMDRYGKYPFDSLPRLWKAASEKYSVDSIRAHGIVPWWIQTMLARLTNAFKERDKARILKLSAEIGHYVADAHVPLHTSSNHNGQLTNQQGIHGFWESRVPELLAEKEWDFFAGRARYVNKPLEYTWKRVLESAKASDSVLQFERNLNRSYPAEAKYAFEERNGTIVKQYSSSYTAAYDRLLGGMVERRLKEAIYSVASLWFTAWVNAGQPDLRNLSNSEFSDEQSKEFEELNKKWREGIIKGKGCD